MVSYHRPVASAVGNVFPSRMDNCLNKGLVLRWVAVGSKALVVVRCDKGKTPKHTNSAKGTQPVQLTMRLRILGRFCF